MYLLDTNVFIEAKNRYYGMDFAPGFWDWLHLAHGRGQIFTVRAVADEIAPGDELSSWFKALPSSFVFDSIAEDAPHLEALAVWANSSTHYRREAIAEFLGSADYRLVAQAKTLGFTIVTHEIADPNRVKRIKIPEACNQIGVPYANLFDVLRQAEMRLKL